MYKLTKKQWYIWHKILTVNISEFKWIGTQPTNLNGKASYKNNTPSSHSSWTKNYFWSKIAAKKIYNSTFSHIEFPSLKMLWSSACNFQTMKIATIENTCFPLNLLKWWPMNCLYRRWDGTRSWLSSMWGWLSSILRQSILTTRTSISIMHISKVYSEYWQKH